MIETDMYIGVDLSDSKDILALSLRVKDSVVIINEPFASKIYNSIHKADILDSMLEEIVIAQHTHTPTGNIYTDRRKVYEIVEATQAKYKEIK